MRTRLLSCLALLAMAAVASADSINLSYTTFGGYNPNYSSPPTPDMGTVTSTANSATLTTSTGNPTVGALWMDTGVSTTANNVSLSFDIKVLSQAASGYGQSFGGAQTLGGVRIWQNANWAVSFQLMPTSATTGTFAFRNETNDGVLTIGSYDVGTLYSVTLTADYLNNLATASIDGGAPVNYGLRTGNIPGGTTSEIFMYMNGVAGANNSIFISDPTVVPLPNAATAGLVGLAGLGVGQFIRRRKALTD